MTKEKKLEAVKKSKCGYTLEVSVNDVEYKGSGDSMVEALAGFVASKDFPVGVKTRVLLKFSDGKKSGSQVYRALIARRLFSIISHKPSALEVLAAKIEQRMS